jgi:hypothetical protein
MTKPLPLIPPTSLRYLKENTPFSGSPHVGVDGELFQAFSNSFKVIEKEHLIILNSLIIRKE